MAERDHRRRPGMLAELGRGDRARRTGGRSAREQRIIAGFEEIERFVEQHGRLPQHGEDRDIFERLYAVRLDRMRESAECRAVLEGRWTRAVCSGDAGRAMRGRVEDEPDDEELLASLGVEASTADDVTSWCTCGRARRSRPRRKSRSGTRARTSSKFRPIFEKVQERD